MFWFLWSNYICLGKNSGWLGWGASQVMLVVKNHLSRQETQTWVWSLGWKDPLEEGMATHSSILAWRIPCTEEPGGLQSMGSQRDGHDWSDLARMHRTEFWVARMGWDTDFPQGYSARAGLMNAVLYQGQWPWWLRLGRPLSIPLWDCPGLPAILLITSVLPLQALSWPLQSGKRWGWERHFPGNPNPVTLPLGMDDEG